MAPHYVKCGVRAPEWWYHPGGPLRVSPPRNGLERALRPGGVATSCRDDDVLDGRGGARLNPSLVCGVATEEGEQAQPLVN